MEKAIPVFKKEKLSYSREEKEGYWTFVSKLHPETRELIVNFTGREILELCDGIRSLGEIENEMVNRYPSVRREQIKMDVYKTIASFSRLGIIEWVDGDNPFLYRHKESLKDNLWLAIGQEDDIDREIYGLLSIEIPLLMNVTAAMIKMIISPKEYFKELLKYAQDIFLLLTVRDVTKIRIIELLSEPLDLEMKEILLNEGYKEEGVLQNEFGFGRSARILSRCYEPLFVEKIIRLRLKGGDKYAKNLPITND